ncbi:DUF433 domain-containing protein [Candidatus Poribacteria bacterium]|nr:DUF433 domain-containing protein [Candidatus Poribacteria bacterium]
MGHTELGKYVVVNSNGKLAFNGTQIKVQDVLEMVAEEMNWDQILDRWQGSITREAIAEAISIVSQVFIRKVEKPIERTRFGKYIVADPKVRRGEPTLDGTEIPVWLVLEDVAYEEDWHTILSERHVDNPKEAIAEAITLASRIATQNGSIELGKYVVAHPNNHGKLTFVGTSIFVQDVIKMVAKEMNWDEIVDKWHGSLTKEAIADAISVASQIFIQRKQKPKERIEYGKYIVADPRICHGIVTFNGTRVFVQTALKMVAKEMDWDEIIWECHGSITKDAIAEAISLASQMLGQRAASHQEEDAA